MPVRIHLEQLEKQDVEITGTIDPALLDVHASDELISCNNPAHYDLKAQLIDKEVLITGNLHVMLDCQCVRCLQPFSHLVELKDWSCLIQTHGDDEVEIRGDCIDLTPIIREDLLLAFPRHPLCRADCRGIAYESGTPTKVPTNEPTGSVWDQLNRLKLD